MSPPNRFTQLVPQLWIAQTQVGMFPCLCLAIQGKDAWTIYGAGVDLSQAFQTQFGEQAQVSHMVLPNSFHYLGIAEWREIFPESTLVAAANARARLESKGVPPTQLFGETDLELPEGYAFIELPESKIGELWLQFKQDEASNGLAVGDAFFCMANTKGMAVKITGTLAGFRKNPAVSRLFKYATIINRRAYLDWAQETIKSINPQIFLPQHGEILRGEQVTRQLLDALGERLP